MSSAATAPDVDIAMCHCLNLRKAVRRVTAHYNAHLAPHGVTIVQFSVLAAIQAAQAITVQTLADRLDMSQSALSRGIAPLERGALIAVRPDPVDRRRKTLVLTQEGGRRLDAAASAWRQAQWQLQLRANGTEIAAMVALGKGL